MLVISLGFLLLGGLVLVSLPLVRMASPPDCVDGEMTVDAEGQVIAADAQKGTVTLVLKKDSGRYELARVDACTGKLLNKINIKLQASGS